jgi:hypothetical protein
MLHGGAGLLIAKESLSFVEGVLTIAEGAGVFAKVSTQFVRRKSSMG